MKTYAFLSGIFLMIAILAGCSDYRSITASAPPPPPPPDYVTYDANIKPILDSKCIGCHNATAPLANYNLTTYAGVLGNGTDGAPNAIAGDATCRLITQIQTGHGGLTQNQIDLIYQWVVDDMLRQN
ncbi:hypothetical protein K1X84_05560 [bacterium]|nr:hypothetical protein [bacterium]